MIVIQVYQTPFLCHPLLSPSRMSGTSTGIMVDERLSSASRMTVAIILPDTRITAVENSSFVYAWRGKTRR